jgi:multidrug efflux system membrane fusion protein
MVRMIVPVRARAWQGLLWRLAAAVAPAFALAACGEQEAPDPPRFRLTVTMGEARRMDLQVTSEVVGTLAPWRVVEIAPETTGTVSLLKIELGAQVEEGEVLFCLEPTDAELAVSEAGADLESAQATLSEAEASHSRTERMAQDGVATEDDLDASIRRLLVARALERRAQVNLDQAKELLEDCTVEAPISGEVTERRIEIGENVSAGTPVITLADLGRVKMKAEVTERDRVHLRPGQPVTVAIDALGSEVFEGTIHALGASADPTTLTFPVEIAVDNSEGRLLAGMIARADLVLEERPDSLIVPLRARVLTMAGEGVFTAVTGEDGSPEARFVTVEFGDRHGEVIEVLGGLDEGSPVVVRGAAGLRDGVGLRLSGGS